MAQPAGGEELPFVGRVTQLEQLRAAFDASGQGGRLVIVSGEPGVGKTRLVRTFVDSLAGRTAPVVAWAAGRASGSAPFQVWRSVVRQLREQGPSTGQRLDALLGGVGGEPRSADTDRARWFHELVTGLSDALPVDGSSRAVIVLDDLQWIDEGSAALLATIVDALGDMATLIVGIHRTFPFGASPSMAALRAAAARLDSTAIELAGLDEASIDALLRSVPAAARSISATDLAARTGGNAFFVREVVRWLAGGGAPDELPPAVRDTVRARLAALPPVVRDALVLAAHLGRDFDLAVLADALGQGAGVVAGLVAEAERTEFVRSGDHPGRFSFVHDVVREAVYGAVPSATQVLLHGRCAAAIESTLGPDLGTASAEALVALAEHATRSAALDNGERAARSALATARLAMRTLAFEDAIRWYERVLAARPGALDEVDACLATVELGDALRLAGSPDRARAAYRDAGGRALALRQPELFARCALGFGGSAFADVWLASGHVDAELVELLRRALDALGSRSPALRSQLLSRLATARYADPVEDRIELTDQAIVLAESSGDPGVLGFALLNRAWALWGPDGVEARHEAARRAVELAERTGDTNLAVEGLHLRVVHAIESGDAPGYRSAVAAYRDLAAELGQPHRSYTAAVLAGMAANLEGRFDEAAAQAETVLRLGRVLQPEHSVQSALTSRFVRLRALGRGAELISELEGIVAAFPAVVAWQCALAAVYADCGRSDEAKTLLDRLAANGFGELRRDWNFLTGAACAAEAAHATGHRTAARLLYDLLEPVEIRVVVIADAVAFLGPRSFYLGLLALTLGDRSTAAAYLRDADTICASFGSTPVASQVRAALARADVPSVAADAAVPFGLTPREREVLDLLAAGLTAPQIAARLSISPHTAANHTKRVLHKLGAATRTQAVTVPVRHGLVAT